jgi:hypothetical protein
VRPSAAFLARLGVLGVLGVLASFGALVGACNPVPDSAFQRRDAGPPPGPVDPTIVADRVSRYTSVADRLGTERCRCAGDYDFCRHELSADWDPSGQACLGDVVRLDADGVGLAVSCLETAIATFEACHGALACPFATERQDCMDSWTSEGSACLAQMNGTAQVALAGCEPTTADAGP